jgi:hypothetical protein
MGGRGAESHTATNARAVENMNGAQLDKEIEKTKAELAAATVQRAAAGAEASAVGADMREAFPLGTAGLDRRSANKIAGNMAERSVSAAKKLAASIDRQHNAEKRLETLQRARKEVGNSGKTQKQLRETPKTKGTMKWSIAQKESYSGGVLKPRILKSGSFEIRGKSVLKVYHNGSHIGTAATLSAAKQIAERYKAK